MIHRVSQPHGRLPRVSGKKGVTGNDKGCATTVLSMALIEKFIRMANENLAS